MPKSDTPAPRTTAAAKADVPDHAQYCDVRHPPIPDVPSGLNDSRMNAIILGRNMWVNGTVLRYCFFDKPGDKSDIRFSDGTSRTVSWVGNDANRNVVRQAFKQWKDVGIGLDFIEVADHNNADVRIGFQLGAGSWSYVGRDVRNIANPQRTMNFGWDLTASAYGMTTALHEIGHTLGMPHEHQNPYAGIVWDEAKVYAYFGGPPNNWDRQKTFNNVMRKLSTSDVNGSSWDPDSVMEYAFPAGLITEPTKYRTQALRPPGGLSALDRQFIKQWYPPAKKTPPHLREFRSVAVNIDPGQQVDYLLKPTVTRKHYVGTFGWADTVVVLFEDIDGLPTLVKGDDDSGYDRNALLEVNLVAGRIYTLRVRLYSAQKTGEFGVMCW